MTLDINNYYNIDGKDKCPFAARCYEEGKHYVGGDWCLTPPYRKCTMWQIYVKQMKDQELIIKK